MENENMQPILDLNKEIVKHPASTFYGRASGDNMKDANINDGDILVIDKSLDAEDGDIAVCCINGEFTLKFIEMHSDHILLLPANKKYEPIKVELEDQYSDTFKIWGIVTHVIHKCSR